MALHNGTHICQPHAPVVVAVLFRIERFKNFPPLGRAYAHTAVANFQHRPQPLLMANEAHTFILLASGKLRFPSVYQQVIYRLSQMHLIAQHLNVLRYFHQNPAFRILALKAFHRRAPNLRGSYWLKEDGVALHALIQFLHAFQHGFVRFAECQQIFPQLVHVHFRRIHQLRDALMQHTVSQQLIFDGMNKYACTRSHCIKLALDGHFLAILTERILHVAHHGRKTNGCANEYQGNHNHIVHHRQRR